MTASKSAILHSFCKSRGTALAILALSHVVACGASQDDGSGQGTNGTGTNGGGGKNGGVGFAVPGANDAGLLPSPGAGGAAVEGPDQKVCGFDTIALERLPAELLLVLDRSSSMTSDRLESGETNWSALTKSVDGTIKSTQGGVLWGLKTFPTTTGCTVRMGAEHDVIVNNYAPISQTIMQVTPGRSNGTPTTAGMKAAAAYLKARTTPNPKYILLATDGQPTCLNGNASREALDTEAAIAAVAAAAKDGFHTFVVGIAPQRQTGLALETLNKMAVAGEEARAGDTKYFGATSEVELTAALGAIAGQVGTCSFALSKVPPSPDDVAVDIDGTRIPQSPVAGWQYNATKTAVILHGPLCEQARMGKLKSVKITFGCPGVVIPVL